MRLGLAVFSTLGLLQAPVCLAADANSKPALKPLVPQEAPTQPAAAEDTSDAPTDLVPVAGKKDATKSEAMPPKAPSISESTQVAELEQIMFGAPQSQIPLEYRLDRLESEVFHQTNPEWSAEKRIARLEHTLIGGGGSPAQTSAAPHFGGNPAVDAATDDILNMTRGIQSATHPGAAPYSNANPYLPTLPGVPNMRLDGGTPQQAEQPSYIPMPANLDSKEYTATLSRKDLEQFALKVVNDARYTHGLPELSWDPLCYKVANELVNDLCKRSTVSHADADGNNPDLRYTKAGGTDCMVESLIGFRLKNRPTPNKALVYTILKELTSHQDDRDALFSKHATNFAFTFDISSTNDKIVACAETVTKQASVEPIPTKVAVGDKIDVRGMLTGPYKFHKITVAWEGTPPPDESQDQDEAAPYFPPLDYEAYAKKSEHDYQKAKQLLQLGGIGLALAGGVFLPPVALAAPLIAAAGSTSRPKAISEIPVRGGVHTDGNTFEYKAPINNNNKEGIYYVTVWALSPDDNLPVAVSRRAIVATAAGSAAPTAQKQTAPAPISTEIASHDKKEGRREKHGD